MTTTLTNAEVAAYLNSAYASAVTPVLTALQALQTAAAAAQATLAGLPSSRTVQGVTNIMAMTTGYVVEFQTIQASLSPLTTAVATSLPALTVGEAVTAFAPVVASGGVGTVSYAIAPALPAGLSFSSSTGQISGTPTVQGSGSYTVTASDQSLPIQQNSATMFSLSIAGAA